MCVRILTPTVHLASQSGNKLKFNDQIDAFVPDKSKQNETSIGASKGTFTLKETLEEGFKTDLKFQRISQIKIIYLRPNSNESKKIHMINLVLSLPKGKILSVLWTFKNDVKFQI